MTRDKYPELCCLWLVKYEDSLVFDRKNPELVWADFLLYAITGNTEREAAVEPPSEEGSSIGIEAREVRFTPIGFGG